MMDRVMKETLLASLPKDCVDLAKGAMEAESSAVIYETGHPEKAAARYERAIIKQNWVIIYLLNELRKQKK